MLAVVELFRLTQGSLVDNKSTVGTEFFATCLKMQRSSTGIVTPLKLCVLRSDNSRRVHANDVIPCPET